MLRGKWVNAEKPKLGHPVHSEDQEILSLIPVQILPFRELSSRFLHEQANRDVVAMHQDEQSSTAKRQKIQNPSKMSGVAHDGGQQFEIKMAAVIGLRGMAMGDYFQLSTNKRGCGNLDDLVYVTPTIRYFLQLKHTDNPRTTKLQYSELVKLLHKSYCSIIQDPTFKEYESSDFIIYTNKQLGPKLLEHNRQQKVTDLFFKTCDTGEIFNFIPDKNKEIDVYTGVEKLVKESKEYRDLSLPQREAKLKTISEFLKKLIMVTGQKGQSRIDDVIIDEIRKLDAVTVDDEVYQTELSLFKRALESWWRDKEEPMTPETLRKWLQEAKTEACTSVVRSLSESCTKRFVSTGIKFTESAISRLQTELSDKPAVHLRSDELTRCSLLLLDCLRHSKCIPVTLEILQSNKNMLLHAWFGGDWEWLIVFCDSTVVQSDISDICKKISEIFKREPSSKRVIIMTSNSVQRINNFVTINQTFNSELLTWSATKQCWTRI